MSLTSNISLRVQSSLATAGALVTASAPLDYALAVALTNGVGAGQADNVYSAELTILTGASQDQDFAGGGLVNAFGAAITFVKVKTMVIVADPTNTTNVSLLPKTGAALPFVTGTTPVILLKPGGFFVLHDPSLAAVAVGAGATDAITLTNAAGATAKVKIIIIGTTA